MIAIRKLILPAYVLALTPNLHAQFTPPDNFGGTTVFSDCPLTAAWGNPALADSAGKWSMAVYAARPFMLQELQEGGVGLRLGRRHSFYTIIGYRHKGFELLRYQHWVLGLGRSFGPNFTAAISARRESLMLAEGYGSNASTWLRTGAVAMLSKSVDVATYADIPLERAYEGVGRNQAFTAGVRFRLSPVFQVLTECSFRSSVPVTSLALRYRPHADVLVFAGISGRDFSTCFGMRCNIRSLTITVSANRQHLPGLSPLATIGYAH